MSIEGAEFAVHVITTAKAAQLILRGHLHVGVAAELHQAAQRLLETGNNVTVCCQRAEHLDTSALQVLLALKEELRAQGKALDLTDVLPSVQSFIQLAGLTEAILEPPTGNTVEPVLVAECSQMDSPGYCREVV